MRQPKTGCSEVSCARDQNLGSESAEKSQLEEALRSPTAKLPENEPKGWLGEVNPDLLKADDFEPDLNAGLSQENDIRVTWLAIVLGFLIFFVPGMAILWLSKRIPIKTKVVTSIVATALVIWLAVELVVHG